jgi:protein phosphatase 2C family protein 2/3
MNIVKPKSKPANLDWPTCSFFAIYDGHGGNSCADFLKDKLHGIIVN